MANDNIEIIKDDIFRGLNSIKNQLREIVIELYKNPEIGGEEFESIKLLKKILQDKGFHINEEPIENLPTAFLGESFYEKSKPNIAFLIEYDALPELGHACGHNASAATSIGAAIALSECIKKWHLKSTVIAIGTPGEENIGSKSIMIKKGMFKNIDLAMMVHSGDYWLLDPKVYALNALEVRFKGRSAHAANSPEHGINALDAVVLTFNGINCLRQQIKDGTRIHGVITKGGDAPNIIPEYCSAKIYVRAESLTYLNNMTKKVKDCAYGASIATGCKLEITSFEEHTDNLKSNKVMLSLFKRNLKQFISEDKIKDYENKIWASSDIGNVSHCMPTIQPVSAIVPYGIKIHTREFAKETMSDNALDNIIFSAYAMACTALDCIIDKNLLESIKKEFLEEETVK